MKRVFIISMTLVALLFASCERAEDQPNWKVARFTVTGSSWYYTDNENGNNYHFYKFHVPWITEWIYNNGIANMYIEYHNKDNTHSMSPLPVVRHLSETVNGKKVYFTETIDYEYSPGEVVFYVTISDFVKQNPGTIDFVLKMIW